MRFIAVVLLAALPLLARASDVVHRSPALISRASDISTSVYTFYGCVTGAGCDDSGPSIYPYTSMSDVVSTCANSTSGNTDALVLQDETNTPISYYCVSSPSTLVDCDETVFAYYSLNATLS